VNDDLHDISTNKSIQHIRHALALHEDRKQFTPEYYWPSKTVLVEMHESGRSLIEAWFTGAHIDMGGSADNAGLALYPLQWMLSESRKMGLGLGFHGNAPYGPKIDDPLDLVLNSDRKWWPYTAANGLRTEMQDLASVHIDKDLALRYSVMVNRDRFLLWEREPRKPFEDSQDGKDAKELGLRGYSIDGQSPPN